MRPQVEIYAEISLSSARQAELEECFRKEFGHLPIQWATPNWYVLAFIDSVLVGSLGLVERVISVDEQTIPIAGIGGVITQAKWRGRKVASTALNKAIEFIKNNLNVDFVLLLCRQEVAPVYAKLGWRPVDGPTTFWQPKGRMTYPHLTMILECGEKTWLSGQINLYGLPW